ncbi:nucleotidyltransferase family protein [Maribellus mangrovi]|uniref:nucleotidyltransferase family protein n=1 Tax=Maribellus mangrovi TaxID=3133146 RepID=UPI0030ED85A9
MIEKFDREILYQHHQLSHDQIDDLLGENRRSEFPGAKAQHLPKLAEFNALISLFIEEGIEFIPFKGPILSYLLYKDPLYRNYQDLDFFIKAESLSKAYELLLQRGYSSPYFSWPESEQKQQRLFKYTNQAALIHPAGELSVEFHWQPFKSNVLRQQSIQELLWNNTRTIDFGGQTIKLLNREFELLYLIIHGGLHRWERLKWLVDIKDYLVKVGYEQSVFSGYVKELKAGRMVALCNAMLKEFFPDIEPLSCTTKVSPWLLKKNNESINRKEEQPYDDSFKGLTVGMIYLMRCFPGLSYKWNVLKTFNFTYDQLDRKGLLAHPLFHNLYRLIKKLIRRFS